MKKCEGDHRYFDINGNQLTFNDPTGVDNHWLTNPDIAVGDRLFMNVSKENVTTAIGSVSQNFRIIMLRCMGLEEMAYPLIGAASWSGADFTFSFLLNHYDNNRDQVTESPSYIFSEGDKRAHYQENFVNFRFEGTNSLYNLYDAGNFMWGSWTQGIGLSNLEVKTGSNLNEFLQFRFGDSKADQKAIFDGKNYKRK